MKVYRCDGCGALEEDPQPSSHWVPRPLPSGWTWRSAQLPCAVSLASLTPTERKKLKEPPAINVQLHACGAACQKRIDEQHAAAELEVAQGRWRSAAELNV